MRRKNIPREEIRFAAKTGFLSRALWDDFFGPSSRSWRSRQWRYLLESGLFLPHPSLTAKHVIVPNPNHKLVRNIVGGEVSVAPYVAQLYHDEIVSRILLPLLRSELVQSCLTEPEQKRFCQDARSWYERQEKLKFPDALLSMNGAKGPMDLALEVELTFKSQQRYRKLFDAYQERNQIAAVIFVIDSSAIFKALKAAMKATQYPDWKRPVGFGRIDEWKKDPVTAPIIFKEMTTSIREMAAGARRAGHHTGNIHATALRE